MKIKQYDPHNYSYIQPKDNDTLEQIVLTGQLDIGNYISAIASLPLVRSPVRSIVLKEINDYRLCKVIVQYLLPFTYA
jgi:hypothetical protein